MREKQMKLRLPAVMIAFCLATSLLVSSCVTTEDAKLKRTPEMLEFVATLEQTREVIVEDKLTYALSRLFGVDNVVVLVSSRAHYGSIEEREGMEPAGNEPQWEFRRNSGPGGIEKVTVAVVVNEDALTPEQKANIEELREKLRQTVADGAGLAINDGSGDSVSIVFMPFAE